jgi:hypothetical protein
MLDPLYGGSATDEVSVYREQRIIRPHLEQNWDTLTPCSQRDLQPVKKNTRQFIAPVSHEPHVVKPEYD